MLEKRRADWTWAVTDESAISRRSPASDATHTGVFFPARRATATTRPAIRAVPAGEAGPRACSRAGELNTRRPTGSSTSSTTADHRGEPVCLARLQQRIARFFGGPPVTAPAGTLIPRAVRRRHRRCRGRLLRERFIQGTHPPDCPVPGWPAVPVEQCPGHPLRVAAAGPVEAGETVPQAASGLWEDTTLTSAPVFEQCVRGSSSSGRLPTTLRDDSALPAARTVPRQKEVALAGALNRFRAALGLGRRVRTAHYVRPRSGPLLAASFTGADGRPREPLLLIITNLPPPPSYVSASHYIITGFYNQLLFCTSFLLLAPPLSEPTSTMYSAGFSHARLTWGLSSLFAAHPPGTTSRPI